MGGKKVDGGDTPINPSVSDGGKEGLWGIPPSPYQFQMGGKNVNGGIPPISPSVSDGGKEG